MIVRRTTPRLCAKCKEAKSPEDFYAGQQSYCKLCVKGISKAYHDKHREKYRQQNREYYRKANTKGAVRSWNARNADAGKRWYEKNKARVVARMKERYQQKRSQLLKELSQECAICKDNKSALVLDHDHHTGVVRGLLCRRCNLVLGYLREEIELLRKMISYIMEGRNVKVPSK